MMTARLLLTKVLPVLGLAPEIINTLFLASIIAKCRLVLRLLIASIAKSAGFSSASKTELSCLRLLPERLLSLLKDSDTGIPAYTLIPISSNCSGDSIPRRKKTRNNTNDNEKNKPRIKLTRTTTIF